MRPIMRRRRQNAAAETAPIAPDPSTFTIHVPHGKAEPTASVTASVNNCRITPPAALPSAIASQTPHPVDTPPA